MNQHKEGLGVRAIAKLFNISSPQTVSNVISGVSKNAESAKMDTQFSPSALPPRHRDGSLTPFAFNTEDRPADRCVIVDAASMEEVRALAAGANVAHGKGNTEADYHNIIKRLMALGDVYMENSFIPDIKKIAESIGAAIPRVRTGYSNYFPNGGLSLRQICVEKRDAAILEKHKEGMSSHKIASLFGMNQKTVSNTINELSKNGESPKLLTPESSTSVLPLANTEDRAETRVDADDFVDSFLSDYDDYISLAEDETESEPAPTVALKLPHRP